MTWRVIPASAIGKYHIDNSVPCQDAAEFRQNEESIFAVVCDGAGSAKHSEIGAHLAATLVSEGLAACGEALPTSTEAFTAQLVRIVEDCRTKLSELAKNANMEIRDLECTLVGAAFSASSAFLFHVGDGLGVAQLKGGESIVSGPANGEYANETFFITEDDWQSNLRVTRVEGSIELIALMSDGAMPFAMNKGQTQLEPKFIDPVVKFLRETTAEEGVEALSATLADERTWSITGDDKTLLLAFPI